MIPENFPRFPLYVPSKGRSQYMITSKALTRQGVPHFLVVEPQQMKEYQEAVERLGLMATVLELDMSYKERYELCDDLGLTRSTGPGPARNFIWDHSIAHGAAWHWVMDDNITEFYLLQRNIKVRIFSPVFWRMVEDFVLRYENVAMAGPQYEMFAPRKAKMNPIEINTRIYSCNLIRNDLPFRWRGRYNEDTILSLDMLIAGYCTIQFNAFLQRKLNTQMISGGNTAEFYSPEGIKHEGDRYTDTGTLAKSKMLVSVHPDFSKLVWRFGRWHHLVNYRPFARNKLRFRPDYVKAGKPNEYGMKIVKKDGTEVTEESLTAIRKPVQ